jgi:Zn/Cd-binding protein ZinT
MKDSYTETITADFGPFLLDDDGERVLAIYDNDGQNIYSVEYSGNEIDQCEIGINGVSFCFMCDDFEIIAGLLHAIRRRLVETNKLQ